MIFFLTASTATAEAIRLTFDLDFNGIPIPSGTLLNDAYPSTLFRFGVDDLVLHTGSGVPSTPNFAVGGPGIYGSGPLDVFFTRPVNYIQASNVSASAWTLLAYDRAGHLLGSVSAGSFPQTVSLQFPDQIRRAQFIHTPGATLLGYGVDDMVLGLTPTPEPSSILLLATGALGIGARLRRLRQ